MDRTLPFDETEALTVLLPYLKKNLGFAEAEIMTVDEAKGKEGPGFIQANIDSAEPGSPGFVFWNL